MTDVRLRSFATDALTAADAKAGKKTYGICGGCHEKRIGNSILMSIVQCFCSYIMCFLFVYDVENCLLDLLFVSYVFLAF